MRALSECVVLVVDDTEANIDILVETLAADYEIGVALDGESALEYALATVPDLVLLDIMMPGLDGYEVCRRLKKNEKTRDIPIIFVTAMAETLDELKGFDLGAVDYITKPFSPPVVQARVKTHLTLKLAREQLAEQNVELLAAARLREDVENITRHDLKGPLNAILGLPYVMKIDPRLIPEFIPHLEMIEESGRRMLRMINQSLDLFKMERGTYQFHPVPVDLAEIARKVLAEIQGLAARKRIRLHLRLDGRPVGGTEVFQVPGEDLLCYSMISNLVKNAVEASPADRAMTVSLESGRRPRIRIHNHGAAPEAIRDRFFDKYVTAGKSGGTGLGTYSARMMAEIQGGTIDLETSEDRGTSITITWPSAAPLPLPAEADSPGAAPWTQPSPVVQPADLPAWRVLAADDDHHVRELLTRYLAGGPLELVWAADGREALDLLTSRHFHLALLDGEMPILDGFETARRRRQWERERGAAPMILIALSGHDDPAAKKRAAEAGFTAYLTKPVDRSRLLEAISRAAQGKLGLEAEPPVHHRTQPTPPEPDQTDDPAEEPIVVEVDADFTGLVDDFLAEKRSEIDWADEARVRRDYESLRAWGHKFGGAALMYGLNELGRLGKDIEIQAEKADIEGVFATLVRLVDYLSRIEVVYVPSE